MSILFLWRWELAIYSHVCVEQNAWIHFSGNTRPVRYSIGAGLTIVANVAIATGSRFWGLAVLCVRFVLYHMQGCVGVQGKLSERGLYILHMLYRNFIRWKQVNFFILSGNLLLHEGTFHIINCLKSFDLKLFFVYTLKLLRAPFGTCAYNFVLFWKTHDLLQSLLSVAL